MSALAEALVAAQRRALAAMQKAFVGGALPAEQFIELCEEIGATDQIDRAQLVAALRTIRELGAAVPAEENGAPKDEPSASQAQRDRIKRDVAKLHGDDAAVYISGEPSLTKAQASEIIDSISKGTFELERYWVPF